MSNGRTAQRSPDMMPCSLGEAESDLQVVVEKTFIDVKQRNGEESSRTKSAPEMRPIQSASLEIPLRNLKDEDSRNTLSALTKHSGNMQHPSVRREGSRIIWTVEAMKWLSNKKHVVSPKFELEFGHALERRTFNMMITFPRTEKKNKSDQKQHKREKHPIKGTLELKCQDAVEEGVGGMTFTAEIGAGAERCRLTHDFSERAVWTNKEQWSFQEVLHRIQ